MHDLYVLSPHSRDAIMADAARATTSVEASRIISVVDHRAMAPLPPSTARPYVALPSGPAPKDAPVPVAEPAAEELTFTQLARNRLNPARAMAAWRTEVLDYKFWQACLGEFIGMFLFLFGPCRVTPEASDAESTQVRGRGRTAASSYLLM